MPDKNTIEVEIELLLAERSSIDTEISRLQAMLNELKTPVTAAGVEIADDSVNANSQMQFVDPASVAELAIGTSVTKASKINEKYDLFMSLFAGRSDVHARRFQNTKGDKTGYSPVCRNEFNRLYCSKGVQGTKRIPCMKCENSDFAAISIDEFIAHTHGRKENCSDVLGAYLMDSAEKCSVIATDFDNENRSKGDSALIGDDGSFESMRAAAVAFRKTCESSGIPAYLERSRSGKGLHVWIFFAESVPAKDARRLCTVLLTKAMTDYPGVRFNSYDRLIPNQDTLPDGGLGNLVALPLQGRAGRNNNSVFVDDELKVYSDQWAHLSCVQKATTSDIDRIIGHMKSSDLGELLPNDDGEEIAKPWEKRKPAVNLKGADFSGTLKIVRSNMLHVEKHDLTPKVVNAIKRLAAFRNPSFYKNQAMRKPTWNEPRIISTAHESDEYISIPRGSESALIDLLNSAGAEYSISDMTTAGAALDVSFVGELWEEQIPAAKAMLEHNIGILSVPTAFGKTVIGAYIIAHRGVNALVLVNTVKLQRQWIKELGNFLNIINKPPERFTPKGRRKKVDVIGAYGGANKNPSGLIDVATMQSLYRSGEVVDFVKDYGLIIIDECHHIPAVSFEAVLKHINAKYVYGLTATPSREDGHHAIMFLQCGPIRYKVDAKLQADKRPFEHYIIPRFTNLLPTSMHESSDYQALLTEVAKDNKRNKMIVQDVLKTIEDKRKPIVLTERKDHATALAEMLSEKCENVILMFGGRGVKEIREVDQRLTDLGEDAEFVIIATGKYVGEGFDFPRLDTLFLALPISWKGKVTQYTGRLHRLYSGKEDVIVYDYVDMNIPLLESTYFKRIKAYKAVGYKTITNTQDDDSHNFIYSVDEFIGGFNADCGNAKKEIVISSPNITMRRVAAIIPVLSAKLIDDAVITVFTKPIDENKESARDGATKCIEGLDKTGITVVHRKNLYHRFAIIDQRIVWYGSINPIGYSETDDGMMRIDDADVAYSLLESLAVADIKN